MMSISQRLRLSAICALCNQYHSGSLAVCEPCHSYLAPNGPACCHCALELPDDAFLICGHCCKKKPAIDQAIAACRFEEPLRSLLHDFKYHEGLYLSSFLANLIVNALPPSLDKTQCLIPVPMHPKRLRQRGFNQAAELAKQLSRMLSIPYSLYDCIKTLNTLPQASLNAEQRRKNLTHAFDSAPIPYEHVTLIDDLVTTGSTVNEIARVLKKNGVTRVDVWCCARA
jgi:ComF family protein